MEYWELELQLRAFRRARKLLTVVASQPRPQIFDGREYHSDNTMIGPQD